MRIARAAPGNRVKQMELERSHEDLTTTFKPYHQIAAELYDRQPSQAYVRAEIERRYRVLIAVRTASLWINKGLAMRAEAAGAIAVEPRLQEAA